MRQDRSVRPTRARGQVLKRKSKAPSYFTLSSFRNIRRLRSFWPLGYFEFNLITFLQALVSLRGNSAVVDEYIRAVFPSDKTVSLGIVEPLYRTFQTFHLRPLRHGTFRIPSAPPDFLPFSGYGKRLSREESGKNTIYAFSGGKVRGRARARQRWFCHREYVRPLPCGRQC